MREGGVWTFEKKKKNSQPSKRSQPKGGRGGSGEVGMVSQLLAGFEFGSLPLTTFVFDVA